MKIKTKHASGKSNVTIQGEMLLPNAAELRKKLLDVLEDEKSISLDLSDVNDVDTSCYQIIVQLKQECTANGKDFAISSMSNPFRDIVSIYGMQSYFDD